MTFQCRYCELYFPLDDRWKGHNICEDCAQDNQPICPDCGEECTVVWVDTSFSHAFGIEKQGYTGSDCCDEPMDGDDESYGPDED